MSKFVQMGDIVCKAVDGKLIQQFKCISNPQARIATDKLNTLADRIAHLERLLIESERADTTADDVNEVMLDVILNQDSEKDT